MGSAISVQVHAGKLAVELADGREVSVPLSWFSWLEDVSDEALRHHTLTCGGAEIYWPELGRGVSVDRLLNPWPNERAEAD